MDVTTCCFHLFWGLPASVVHCTWHLGSALAFVALCVGLAVQQMQVRVCACVRARALRLWPALQGCEGDVVCASEGGIRFVRRRTPSAGGGAAATQRRRLAGPRTCRPRSPSQVCCTHTQCTHLDV